MVIKGSSTDVARKKRDSAELQGNIQGKVKSEVPKLTHPILEVEE